MHRNGDFAAKAKCSAIKSIFFVLVLVRLPGIEKRYMPTSDRYSSDVGEEGGNE